MGDEGPTQTCMQSHSVEPHPTLQTEFQACDFPQWPYSTPNRGPRDNSLDVGAEILTNRILNLNFELYLRYPIPELKKTLGPQSKHMYTQSPCDVHCLVHVVL